MNKILPIFFASMLAGAGCLLAEAQDYSPHRLQGTLPPPTLGWRLRGRYTARLAQGPTPNQFKMEISPTQSTGLSDAAEAKVLRDFISIAKRQCGESTLMLLSDPDVGLFIGHGGDGIANMLGEFQCK